MLPYFAYKTVNNALFASIGITGMMLLCFGYVKAILTGALWRGAVRSAFETLGVGAIAAGASYGIVRGINEKFPHS